MKKADTGTSIDPDNIIKEIKSLTRKLDSFDKNKSKYKDIKKEELIKEWNDCKKRVMLFIKELRLENKHFDLLNDIEKKYQSGKPKIKIMEKQDLSDKKEEELAIDFAEWIDKNIYTRGLNSLWYKIPPVLKGEKSEYTTKELFKLYKNNKT